MKHWISCIRQNFNIYFMLFYLIALFSCNIKPPLTSSESSYTDSILSWQLNRAQSLTAQDGWLALAGRYWLKEGQQSFGPGRSNQIIFPKGTGPDTIGSIVLQNGRIITHIKEGITVYNDGKPVTEIEMLTDADGGATYLTMGSLNWHIIKRGDRYALRLRDSESTARKEFKGLEYFPIDPQWKVKARFIPYDTPRKLLIANVIGTIDTMTSPGYLSFRMHAKHYRLDPVQEEGDLSLFIIFADETSGVETYGGGRFLGADLPDGNNHVILDFNKAYNPPCAFTEYATCPLPPDQNKLKIMITAGEKRYGEH